MFAFLQRSSPILFSLLIGANIYSQEECQFTGSWRIDVPKSSEIMTEEQWEEVSSNLEEAVIRLSFKLDKTFSHSLMDEEGLEMTYTFEPVEAKENTFAIEVLGGPQEMKAQIQIIDENTIRFEPEGFPPTILVRDVGTVEDFQKFLLGNWESNVEAIKALSKSGGWEAVEIPNVTLDFKEDGTCQSVEAGEPDPASTYVIEMGEVVNDDAGWDGQRYVVKMKFDDEEVIDFKAHVIDEDQLMFELDDGSKLIFKRIK